MKLSRIILLSFFLIFCFGIFIVRNNSNLENKNIKETSKVFVEKYRKIGNLIANSKKISIDITNLPEHLLVFVKSPNEVNYNDIKKLSKNLAFEEREILYQWLVETETSRNQLFYKDAMLNKLERQNTFPSEHIGELINLLKNTQLDSDFRGYVIQHLRLNFEVASIAEKSAIISGLMASLSEIDSETAGTALATFSQLAKDSQIEFPTEAKEATTELLSNGALRNQVTAASVVGEQNLSANAEILRDILVQENCNRGLKLAVIGALAKLKLLEDLDLLSNLQEVDGGFYSEAIKNYFKNN